MIYFLLILFLILIGIFTYLCNWELFDIHFDEDEGWCE